MLKKNLIKICMLFFIISSGYLMNAQHDTWNNKRCAVSLTYDDALNVHLDNVIPVLDSLGFKGTFYIPVNFPGFKERINDWKNISEKGHELGNHTMFHPCEGKAPGREWVNPDYDLNDYSVERMMDEIKLTSIILNILDKKTNRTFAYPCGDMIAGDSSYVPEIKDNFAGARGVQSQMQKIHEIDLFDIRSYMIMDNSGDELISLVKEAMDKNALLVFLFHGVGGEHNLNVSLEAHNELLRFLKDNEKKIWVAPLVEIAEFIKAGRN